MTDAHDGVFAMHLEGAGESSTDRRINLTQDAGGCAIAAARGELLAMRAFVRGTTRVRFASYLRDGAGFWAPWASSATFAPSADYERVTWALPAVPAEARALAVGVHALDEGSLTVDDLDLRAASE